jgi:VanZ family protein
LNQEIRNSMNLLTPKRLASSWLPTGLFSVFCLAIILAANFHVARPVFVAVHRVPLGDKIAHFLLVGCLALLLNTVLGAATIRLGRLTLLKGNLILLLITTVEEMSNLLQPHRSFSLADMLFNWLGIFAFGWASIILIQRAQAEENAPMPELTV